MGDNLFVTAANGGGGEMSGYVEAAAAPIVGLGGIITGPVAKDASWWTKLFVGAAVAYLLLAVAYGFAGRFQSILSYVPGIAYLGGRLSGMTDSALRSWDIDRVSGSGGFQRFYGSRDDTGASDIATSEDRTQRLNDLQHAPVGPGGYEGF